MHIIPTDADNLHIDVTHPIIYNDQLFTWCLIEKGLGNQQPSCKLQPPCLHFCSGVQMREQSSPLKHRGYDLSKGSDGLGDSFLLFSY